MRTVLEHERLKWQRFIRFSHILWILTLVTIVLGPYVRAEDAGLACPDWPLCFGHVVPPYEYRVYLEFVHRVVAGFMGLVFIAWLFYLLSVPGIRRTFIGPAILALLLLVTQILLGGATVTELLHPYIVKSHLLNAILYISVLLFIWKKGRSLLAHSTTPIYAAAQEKAKDSAMPPRWLQVTVLVAIFFQIFLGGRVSTNEVGLVCSEFPACYIEKVETNGTLIAQPVYIPPMTDKAFEMHFSHRLMAYALLLLVVALALKSQQTRLAGRNGLLLALLLLQISLGVLNVKWALPVPITVMHSFTAIVLFLTAWLNLLEFKHNEPNAYP